MIRKERSIYLPYDELEEMFEKEGRGVFLPYREFIDLWNKLTLEKKKEDIKPPADGVISSAIYEAKIEGENNRVLAIDATIKAESFKEEGWAVIPLATNGLNIAEADTGTATLHLGAKGYELILPAKGEYELKLKFYARVTGEAGKNEAKLQLPRAGVSKFVAQIPEQDWEFELKPAAAFSTRDKGADTELSFFFGKTESFDLVWQKQGEATGLTPLLFVETESNTLVVPGALQTDIKLNYRILRSGVSQFSITVPDDQEILSVEGENIKEWDVVSDGDQQKLSVSLHAPAKKSYQLIVALEQALGSLPAQISPPQFEAENVVRQRGVMLVSSSPELELTTVSTDGLSQQSLALAPKQDEQIKGKVIPYALYRYLTLPNNLTVSVKRAEPVIEVESWTRFRVEPDSAKFQTRFDYDIKRAGIFNTEIEIPRGFDGVEATGDLIKDFSEQEVDDKRILSVVFKNKLQSKISFTVTGRQNRDNAADDTLVPVFAPLNVDRHDGKLALTIHTSLDPGIKEAGNLRQQDVSLLSSRVPGMGPVQIGFRYRGEAEPATVSYTLKKPQITGEVLTMVEVREQLVRYQWTISWQVRYAGVDTFIISVPESISDHLRHQGTLIKEVEKDRRTDELEPPAGKVFWAIVLRDKKLGKYQLTLDLDLPVGPDIEGEAENGTNSRNFAVDLPEIQLHRIQTETGQIAVVKDDSLEILDAKVNSLEGIDPTELRQSLAKPGVFLSYKYRRHPHSLNLSVSRNEFLPVPQAVVTYADLTSVLSADAALTTEVIYWVRNNAKQFFSVTLPENGKMVSDIYVNGSPRQPMRRANEDVVLIRLPVDQTNRVFPVRFIYEVPSSHPGRKLRSGSIKIPVAELKDSEILQSRLQLYVPNGYAYRKFVSSMTLPIKEQGWTRFRNAVDWLVPTLGPQVPISGNNLWNDPPSLPDQQQGGFDLEIPKGGQMYPLHRLDEPSQVKVVYRSKAWQLFIEALAGLLVFAGAVMLLWYPVKWRFAYFALLGILPLIISGAVAPTSAGFWTAMYLGALAGCLVWFAKSIPALLKYLWGLLLIPLVWLARQFRKIRDRREQRAREKQKTESEKKQKDQPDDDKGQSD